MITDFSPISALAETEGVTVSGQDNQITESEESESPAEEDDADDHEGHDHD
jgi:hypothetical protein